MNKYLIIQKWDTEFPNLKADEYGKPLAFDNIDDANANATNLEKVIVINI